ncbi:ribose 5-phosphate isomerase B [Deltaproteobacteria bacterium OttesenSCG-928-M10]|nr:ribose 5-phosphate isomerase B [Deltaproteobacteria bacterium OttesenSCG-928-M10]
MKIVIASDHAGRNLKKAVLNHLTAKGMEVNDLGVPDSVDKADYPDYAAPLARDVAAGLYDFGVLVCGTGMGMAMAANRIKGARAANCANEFLARMTRAHNNANILTLGERVTGEGLALAIVDVFLETPYEGGRHQARLDKF